MSETSALRVYRRATNFNYNLMRNVFSTAAEVGIPVPQEEPINFYAHIIAPGELLAIMRSAKIKNTASSVRVLGDYLADYLPSSVHDRLTVPTFPLAIKPGKIRRPSRQLVSIDTLHPVAQTERIAAQCLVRAHVQSPDSQFKENDAHAKVHIAHFKLDPEREKATAFKNFLERHPDLLPAEVELGPLEIEQFSYTE